VFRASIAAADPYNDAAQAWLSWVDHGQYAESWAAAGAYFRAAITKPAWEQAVKAARDPLGALKIRSLESETATNTLPGAPDGQYEVLRFQSAFANKAAAVEILTLKREGDAWKVAGYFIK
jgi:hypothetical protein